MDESSKPVVAVPASRSPSHNPGPRWTLIVPQKDLRRAKSRLQVRGGVRRSYAIAMLEDTVDAALTCGLVQRVLVTCDRLDDSASVVGASVHALSSEGLRHNAAIEAAEAFARSRFAAQHVAVIPGDLPALEPDELRMALDLAAQHPRSFVRDADGTGTTLLAARAGNMLMPIFGRGSAEAHEVSGAVELNLTAGMWSLRDDVDDVSALERALATGRAPRTREAVERTRRGRLRVKLQDAAL